LLITHSVNKNILAIDTAFSNATLVTLAGSMIPLSNRLQYSFDLASYPILSSLRRFSTTCNPHTPAFSAILIIG
jgi:hypothetical protein